MVFYQSADSVESILQIYTIKFIYEGFQLPPGVSKPPSTRVEYSDIILLNIRNPSLCYNPILSVKKTCKKTSFRLTRFSITYLEKTNTPNSLSTFFFLFVRSLKFEGAKHAQLLIFQEDNIMISRWRYEVAKGKVEFGHARA